MELRYNEVANARDVFAAYVLAFPSVTAYTRFAKFEMKNGEVARARGVYEAALEALGRDGLTQELLISFAEFEEMASEHDRARGIYKYALDMLPRHEAGRLYERFVAFEKQHGGPEAIEQVVISKRRF